MSHLFQRFKKRFSHHEDKERQTNSPPEKPTLTHTPSSEKLITSDKVAHVEKQSVANASEADAKGGHRRTPTISKPVIGSPSSTVRMGKPDKNLSNHDLEVCETVLAFMITHPEELSGAHFPRYKKILGLASALTRTQDRAKSKPGGTSTTTTAHPIVQAIPSTSSVASSNSSDQLLPPPTRALVGRHSRSGSTSAAVAAVHMSMTAGVESPPPPVISSPYSTTVPPHIVVVPPTPTTVSTPSVATSTVDTLRPAPISVSASPPATPTATPTAPAQRSRPPSLGGGPPSPIPLSPAPRPGAQASPVSQSQVNNLVQVSAAAAAAAGNTSQPTSPTGQTQLRASVLMRVKQIIGEDLKGGDSVSALLSVEETAALTGTASGSLNVNNSHNIIDHHLQQLQHQPPAQAGVLGEPIYPADAVDDIVDVYFRSLHGAPISMVVSLSDTVADCKRRLKFLADGTLAEAEENDDESPSNKDLEYEGNTMEDDRTLADYDVFEFCAIRCLPRK